MSSRLRRQPLLNANQRRHFDVLFAGLEQALLEVEKRSLASSQGNRHLTADADDLPPAFAAAAKAHLDQARRLIREVAADWQLKPGRVSRRASLNAILVSQLIRLQESGTQQLRGYGEVDPSVEEAVPPVLAEFAGILKGLLALLRG